jgi:hypothetical protein
MEHKNDHHIMALEIQVLTWDRHKNMAVLILLIGFGEIQVLT